MTSERRARIAAQSAPTPPLGAASARQRRVERPRSRVRWIRYAAAVVAGTIIGGGLALYAEPVGSPPNSLASAVATPASSAPAAATASASSAGSAVPPGSSAGTATPHASSAGAGADPRVAAVAQVKDAVRRFAIWSRNHLGAHCPDAATLGAPSLDPWNRPLRIVCADQPADQIAGVLSLGPDGLPGTLDDVASWALGPEVTDLLRGSRWASSRSVSASAGGPRVAPAPHTAAPRAMGPVTSPAASRTAATATSPAASRAAATATSLAASRTTTTAISPAASAAPAPTAAPSSAVPPPAKPNPKPPAPGAGSDDIDGDGIPDRR